MTGFTIKKTGYAKDTLEYGGSTIEAFSHSRLGNFAKRIARGSFVEILVPNPTSEAPKIYFVKKSDYKRFCSEILKHHLENNHFDEKNIKKLLKSKNGKEIIKSNDLLDEKINRIESLASRNFVERIFKIIENQETIGSSIAYNNDLKMQFLSLVENSSTFSSLEEEIVAVLTDESKKDVGNINRIISHLHHSHASEDIHALTEKVSKNIVQSASKITSSSLQERDSALRSPNEILVDLMAFVKNKEAYRHLDVKAKSLFLTHTATIDSVKEFLAEIVNSHVELSEKISILQSQLMVENIYTRLNDNIYGRVFDSAFVTTLVKNPPKEVQNAMTSMANGLAEYLDTLNLSSNDSQKISAEIKDLLVRSDHRFWFPATPELESISRTDDEDVVKGLIDYLLKEKKSGYECISVPYLIVKLGNILKDNRIFAPWVIESTFNFFFNLEPQAKGLRIVNEGAPLKTKDAGITLHYQPSENEEEWMVPSARPTINRKPDLEKSNLSSDQKKSLKTQMEHGIPWASGMSGSTNICMYARDYFNSLAPIDLNATILGTIMFLVHDGGHSLHEPLWALSQITKKLDLNLDLGSGDDLPGFISDYEKFQQVFTGNLHLEVKNAFDQAFERVNEYYGEHSFYAKDNL